MRASPLLKAASVVSGLLFVGHTLGMPWTPDRSARGATLVADMKALRFPVMGFERGYWDFYEGFGLTVSVFLLAFTVLLWQAARMAARAPESARPIIATSLGAFGGMAILEPLYFFAAPIVLTVPIVALLAWALLELSPGRAS